MPKTPVRRPVITATEIAEYIAHHSCARRAKLTFIQNDASRKLPFAGRVFAPLDVALKQSGAAREVQWEQSLLQAGLRPLHSPPPVPTSNRSKKTPRLMWAAFLDRLSMLAPGQQVFGREVEISGDIGAFRVTGRIDFLLLLWQDGQPYLKLAEGKAARQDRMAHIAQVALYKMLLSLLTNCPLTIGGKLLGPRHIECVVARIDETTGDNQNILSLPPLDLTTEMTDLTRLLAEDGPLSRIHGTELDSLPFHIAPKCHDCVTAYHCISESARQRRLELLGIEPALVTALRCAGIATIDALADLEIDSPQAHHLRSDPQFSAHLPWLIQRALARRKTLPGGDRDLKGHAVEALHGAGDGQLPPHRIEGQPLVRVFLEVNFDHIAARVGCIVAHVTTSEGKIHTPFRDLNGKPTPAPELSEVIGEGENARRQLLSGADVVEILPSAWTGDSETDAATERGLLQRFFQRLAAAISEVTEMEYAPLHLYLWRRADLAPLVEACRRCGGDLLWHLSQLLGCRENLEQMLFSALQEEVHARFALGWTSRTLIAATSLPWFGQRFHWTRNVNGVAADLSKVFFRDHHDFLTGLHFTPDGKWATARQIREESVERHTFEIRTRFFDALSPAYLAAHLNALPPEDAPGLDLHDRAALREYRKDARPGMLAAYLTARVHGLRWIEERIKDKNRDVAKPLLYLPSLTCFSLGSYTPARAAVDYLRLEFGTARTAWLARMLAPPLYRVPDGNTIPVRDARRVSKEDIVATIDMTGYGMDKQAFKKQCSLGKGAFVRLAPCNADPSHKQTARQFMRGGITCRITGLDWESGEINLRAVPGDEAEYWFASYLYSDWTGYDRATLDPSATDFTAPWVERRLRSQENAPACRWLDPQGPQIPSQSPLPEEERRRYSTLVSAIGLNAAQQDAALRGLDARVQTLQGPPGTGKSFTAAIATLLRILARCKPGDVVLVSATTHMALTELLEDLHEAVPRFAAQAEASGLLFPHICLSKAHTSKRDMTEQKGILSFDASCCRRLVTQQTKAGVLLAAGTPLALLKMAKELNDGAQYRTSPEGFSTPLLIVDEASMMSAANFLALATLVGEMGAILLAGDHRQLAPIQSHTWEEEDRPPVKNYLPQCSAFQFVRDLKAQIPDDHSLLCSGLTHTYRLAPAVRRLLAPFYAEDGITLIGDRVAPTQSMALEPETFWGRVWGANADIALLIHNETTSQRSNAVEAGIIARLLASARLPDGTVGCLTPHRAQRVHLTDVLAEMRSVVSVIDTVERLQGGERKIIIVSATASEPAAIAASAEFLLDVHRALVALSRAQERLIVAVAASLLDHIPADRENYLAARLWKSLREVCPAYAGETTEAGYKVRLYLSTEV